MVRHKELKINISNMQVTHVKEIEKIEIQSFPKPWSYNAILEEIENPAACFLVASLDNDKVVGYIGSHIVIDGCYITNLAVSPMYRKTGIAKKLLTELIRQAKLKGLKFLTLEARESNNVAIKLYKSFAFLEKGKRKNFYTKPQENAIILTKFIN